jgi:hypothetical protein
MNLFPNLGIIFFQVGTTNGGEKLSGGALPYLLNIQKIE